MKTKKRLIFYLMLSFLALPFIHAEPLMQFKLDFYSNGNVFLKDFQLVEGEPSPPSKTFGGYTFQVMDNLGRLVYEQKIHPEYGRNERLNSILLRVPYQERYETLLLLKGKEVYLRKPIRSFLCNLDGICDPSETSHTCSQDCSSQACSSGDVCDASCPQDPDCDSPIGFPWMYLALALVVIGVTLFGCEAYLRIQTKHKLLQTLDLPSQAGIGTSPARETQAPPTLQNPLQPPRTLS